MSLGIGMVTIDCADPKALASFWSAALDAPVMADYGEFIMLQPPAAGGPAIGLQRVPEERAGKNRLHLDLSAEKGQREAEVKRLVGLGATSLGDRGGAETGGYVWTTLTDPEGNEFDVGEPPASVPAAP